MPSLINYYRQELKRAAWRLQYRARCQRQRELPYQDGMRSSFIEDPIEERLDVQALIASLPSEMGKTIIYELYFLEKSEKEIAAKLHISQQAVSKWKKKMLHFLFLKMTS